MTSINPWAIVSVLATLILAAVGGFFYGQHVENLAWTAKVEQQHADAANQIALATAQTAAIQHKLDAINTDTETQHAQNVAAIDAANAENERLSSELNRLLLSGSGAGGAGAVPGSAHPTTGSGQLSAAYQRATGLVADLLTAGNHLDGEFRQQAAAAAECRDWAMKVTDVEVTK